MLVTLRVTGGHQWHDLTLPTLTSNVNSRASDDVLVNSRDVVRRDERVGLQDK